jgi:hypothetical protein
MGLDSDFGTKPNLLEAILTAAFGGAFCAATVDDFGPGTGLAGGADLPQSGLLLVTAKALTPAEEAAELGPATVAVDVVGLDFAGFVAGTRPLRDEESVEIGFFFTGAGGTMGRLGCPEDDVALSTLDVGRLNTSFSFVGAGGTGGGGMGTRRGPVAAPAATAGGGFPEFNCTR